MNLLSHPVYVRVTVKAKSRDRANAASNKDGDVPNNLDAEYPMGSRLTGRNDFPSCYRNAIISSTRQSGSKLS